MFALIIALASGFFLFPWWLVIVEIILGITVWSFLDHSSTTKRSSSDRMLSWLWLLILLGLVVARVFPFSFSHTPLGYDTGIYRFEIFSSFHALPGYVSGLFLGLPLLTDVAQLFGMSVDQILGIGYGAISILVGLSLSGLAERSWGRREGLLVLFLFAISLVQWKAYTMILMKQLLAMALIFFSFCLLRRRSFLALLPLAFVALLQPLDAFLAGISLIGYSILAALIDREQRWYLARLFIIGAGAAVAVLILEPQFWTSMWQQFSLAIFTPGLIDPSLQKGVFISLEDFGYQSAFFFIFGVIGWWQEIRARRLTVTGVYFLVLLLWITLRLFFYQRLLIQLDAMLIFYAGFALLRFTEALATDRLGKALLLVLFLGMTAPLMINLARFTPLISPAELTSIEGFCQQVEPNAFVAATDSYYAPWLKGYCLDQRVFGPGLFDDNHWSRSDWESFWKGDRQRTAELLKQYEGPLYFYVGTNQVQIELNSEQFEWVSKGWWRRS